MLDPKLKKAAVADINTALDGFTALHFAASECQLEIVKDLITRPGIDLEAVNNDLRTPLHLAAQRGSLEICQILCKIPSINKSPKDNDENTPLHLAS
jgi:ankyrin repeat protein